MSNADLRIPSATRRYRQLGAVSAATPADFRNKPDCLFGAHDIAAAGIVGSRASLHRALNVGKFPAPMRLPSGRLAWYGKTISVFLDSLEQAAASNADYLASDRNAA